MEGDADASKFYHQHIARRNLLPAYRLVRKANSESYFNSRSRWKAFLAAKGDTPSRTTGDDDIYVSSFFGILRMSCLSTSALRKRTMTLNWLKGYDRGLHGRWSPLSLSRLQDVKNKCSTDLSAIFSLQAWRLVSKSQ